MEPRDPAEPTESPRQAAARRTLRAELIIATLALLTSACASVAAILQTRESAIQTQATIDQTQTIAKQLGASVWPYLTVENDFSPRSVGLRITNQGLGPALIRTFRITFGRQAVTRMSQVTASIDPASLRRRVSETDLGGGSVIRPSETFTLFEIDDAELDRPRAAAMAARVRSEICYCSLLHDCWLLRSPGASEPHAVANCGKDTRAITL